MSSVGTQISTMMKNMPKPMILISCVLSVIHYPDSTVGLICVKYTTLYIYLCRGVHLRHGSKPGKRNIMGGLTSRPFRTTTKEDAINLYGSKNWMS